MVHSFVTFVPPRAPLSLRIGELFDLMLSNKANPLGVSAFACNIVMEMGNPFF